MIIAGDAGFGNSDGRSVCRKAVLQIESSKVLGARDERYYLRYSLGKMRTLVGLAIIFLAAVSTQAQTCPPQNSDNPDTPGTSVALHGTLVYHDDLREWLGLKLDHPACGQTEIQLVFPNSSEWRRAQSLRECPVTASGTLYESPTGYYSAKFAIGDAKLKPDPSCHPFPIKPDLSVVPIPATVEMFHASIAVDYRGKGHVEVKVWKNEHALLKPWQAYVNYMLTGSPGVIWFGCQEDFRITDITQTPKSRSGIFAGGSPNLTGTALQDLEGANTISFTCQRILGVGDVRPTPPGTKPK